MKRILGLIAVFMATSAHAEVQITRSIHYGSDSKQIVDVYQPDQCRTRQCPVTMWVHGGGWRHGNTSGDRSTEMQTAWANQGIVMVGVNYRLSPEYKHPAHIEDVASAVSWVHDHISQYGGDPNRVSLLGHSAGAHLVALVATNPTYLGAHHLTPKGALANVFPIDTASFDLTHPSRVVERMVREAFGTDQRMLREASPIWNVVSGGSYPPFIMAATRVRRDAVETSQTLQSKLKAVGVSADLIIKDYPGVGQLKAHGKIAAELADMNSEMTQTLIRRVLSR